jgi:hypothetical protein
MFMVQSCAIGLQWLQKVSCAYLTILYCCETSRYVVRRKIEAIPPAQWTQQLLPQGFTKAARDVLHTQTSPSSNAFHDFVERARTVLSSSASAQAKINLLAFMEPLCSDDNAADALINTPLSSALIQLIESSNTPLKAQACLTFGLLVRHAKFIDMTFVGPGALCPLQTSLLHWPTVQARFAKLWWKLAPTMHVRLA